MKEARIQIQESIEGKWRRTQIKFWIIALCALIGGTFLLALIAAFWHMDSGSFSIAMSIFGILSVAWIAVFLPFVCYHLYEYCSLFRGCEAYEQHEAVLDKPNTSWWYRGAVYYTVSFKTNDRRQITLDTKPLWSGSVFDDYQLQDYNNKKIDIFYDKEHERVIVLGLHGKK